MGESGFRGETTTVPGERDGSSGLLSCGLRCLPIGGFVLERDCSGRVCGYWRLLWGGPWDNIATQFGQCGAGLSVIVEETRRWVWRFPLATEDTFWVLRRYLCIALILFC